MVSIALKKYFSIYIFVGNTFNAIGCWIDKGDDRAIPEIANFRGDPNPIQKCFELAKSLGYTVFALQDNGACHSSPDAGNTYDKHGSSTDCPNSGRGGPWLNNVYEIVHGNVYVHRKIPV